MTLICGQNVLREIEKHFSHAIVEKLGKCLGQNRKALVIWVYLILVI